MKLEAEKRKFVGAILYTSPIAKPEASVKQIHVEIRAHGSDIH
jgi:hypothetical protein